MVTAALITVPGFEDIAAAEVKWLIGVKATLAEAGAVTFKAEPSDVCRLCCLSQSANSFLVESIPVPFDFNKRDYLIFGQSNDIKGNLAYLLLRAAGYDPSKHFLFDPFTRSGAIAVEAALFSSGFPVNYYRRDALSAALSSLPQFSAAAIRKAFSAMNASPKRKEARPKILASSQLMQDVRSAEKNAKVAGVNKLVNFSRLDIEWLDAKLDERSVDLIVSYPPQFRSGNGQFATSDNSKLKSLYKDFFTHAGFFMKRTGSVALLLNDETKDAASSSASKFFKQKPLRTLQLGNEKFELVSFAKL